jgi:hypothetical protein
MDEDYYSPEVMIVERNAVAPPPMMRSQPRVARPWPPRVYPAPYYRPPYPPQRPVVIVQRQPSLLSEIDLGEVIAQGTTLIAAMQSLPDAPQVTGDPSKDVGNMILYQESLADHAKSDERVRAFGGLVAQIVKMVVKNAQPRVGA